MKMTFDECLHTARRYARPELSIAVTPETACNAIWWMLRALEALATERAEAQPRIHRYPAPGLPGGYLNLIYEPGRSGGAVNPAYRPEPRSVSHWGMVA